MSVISPCHLRREVLRPSYVVHFETALSCSDLGESQCPTRTHNRTAATGGTCRAVLPLCQSADWVRLAAAWITGRCAIGGRRRRVAGRGLLAFKQATDNTRDCHHDDLDGPADQTAKATAVSSGPRGGGGRCCSHTRCAGPVTVRYPS
jgi:hypothetical protein